jgi:hypothetical protein
VVEPLDPPTAKALAAEALRAGSFFVTDHARKRLAQRKLKIPDIHRIIKSGVYQQANLEDGTWRYPIWTVSITVVIAFRAFSPPAIRLVTAYQN